MTTYTVTQKCEAGHVRSIQLIDIYTLEGVKFYAAMLDGSSNPEINAKLRAMNDLSLRVGRCNLPLSPHEENDVCNAWIECTVTEGAMDNPDTILTPGGDGSVRFTASIPTPVKDK